jgi:hypothetical protein
MRRALWVATALAAFCAALLLAAIPWEEARYWDDWRGLLLAFLVLPGLLFAAAAICATAAATVTLLLHLHRALARDVRILRTTVRARRTRRAT